MPYFKNSELAYTYHVSDRTVRNWVALAKEGKLPLELEMIGDKAYVAKTSGNIKIVEEYVARNKTKRPHNALKIITPDPKFYELFTPSQAYDIIYNLEMYREIPREYNYFDGGAREWSDYATKLAEENNSNLINRTISLLKENKTYIDSRLAKYEHVNIVDIGVGNALPVKELLSHLLKQNKLARYIAIDISQEMLQIAHNNIKQWFGSAVKFEAYEMDITHERFRNILAGDYLGKNSEKTGSLVLCLGGTAFNFRDPDNAYRNISESLGQNDYFICTDKLTTPNSRPEWYKYETQVSRPVLAARHKLVFDLLNINESFYEVEIGYEPQSGQHYTRARMKITLDLKFEFEEGQKSIRLEKGDTILLWRFWQMTAEDMAKRLKGAGMHPLHLSQTDDREYLMTMAQAMGKVASGF